MKKVILVGGFHEIIELCEECGLKVVGIIDNLHSGFYYGVPVIGTDEDAGVLFSDYRDCKVVITPDSPKVREKLVHLYESVGFDFATVISPFAHISKYAVIGKGTVIQAGVNISSSTVIGSFCKLNSYCNVMHDNSIADFTTIAPNAVLLGKVITGKGSYIGANATILPNISIGAYSTVGAGAVVTRNVPENITVKGVPAKHRLK
jgi:sugar O-acyltransferase (sialic acid O-acetyltransferase NeuD family)